MSPEARSASTRHAAPLDPEALRAKYQAERDKRLRGDGNAQYRPFEGDFARLLEDPYVKPGFTREPVSENPAHVLSALRQRESSGCRSGR